MHWNVAAPFFTPKSTVTARWLDNFIPGNRHLFTKILRQDRLAERSWHNRAARTTQMKEWLGYWQQSGSAWDSTQGGVITVFPQLAGMVALRKRLSRKAVPTIAWCFNLGKLYPGLKQMFSRSVLQEVDRFIVHSRRECETVSAWLEVPQENFEFVPLQRSPIPVLETEDIENPFILAMGSANRDYQTFFDAVEPLGIRTVVVAGQHALNHLRTPANVEILSGLTPDECYRLAQKARLNVIPLQDTVTAAGQVTLVETMRMSRPVIATRCVGTEDYIQHGKTGLLVKPYSSGALVDSIGQLWSDAGFRHGLAKQAGIYAQAHCSDEIAGSRLGKILDQF
jgi:glycosyltransferase involved in cell wall biosynthesis